MQNHILSSLNESARALDRVLKSNEIVSSIERAAQILIQAIRNGNRIYSAGNGGSMCDAMHFAEELSGRYRKDRPGIAATAISDVGHLTCSANDFGYEHVFSRYLECHARAGDVFVGFSTSGKSANIIKAAHTCNTLGAKVIALTGREGSELAKMATVEVCMPGGEFADRVQELHIKAVHIFIELIERNLFPQNYEK